MDKILSCRGIVLHDDVRHAQARLVRMQHFFRGCLAAVHDALVHEVLRRHGERLLFSGIDSEAALLFVVLVVLMRCV